MMSSITREMIAAYATDGEHRRLLEEIGLTSYLCLPLSSASGTLGAITLAYADSGRRYTDHDLAFAQELAARAAGMLARKVFATLWDRNLYIGGAMNILDQPEFGDIAAMRALLRTFEEKRQLIELLTTRASGSDGVQVLIGSEMPYQEMQETSLVAACYKYRDRVLGVLGVVGPRRMPYARIVPLVDYAARLVSRRLSRVARSETIA